MTRNSKSWLKLKRTVRFGDTDAAGVMHFLQLLKWCHEAWEESLENYGLKVSDVFPNADFKNDQNQFLIFLPIVHCQADFWRPLQIGDLLEIELTPEKLDKGSFQSKFKFTRDNDYVAQGLIKHQAINSFTRSRSILPEGIELWLEASSFSQGITTCE